MSRHLSLCGFLQSRFLCHRGLTPKAELRIADWLTRVRERVGPLNDLEPYPQSARAGWRTQTLGS